MRESHSSQGGEYQRHVAATKLTDPVHKPALEQYPELSSSIKLKLSWIELEQGNLAAAKALASEAAALAEEFSTDRRFQVAARLQEALAAQTLQETAEAERLVAQVQRQLTAGFPPCARARQYSLLAWIKLMARQSGHAAADPEEFFTQAENALLQCDQPSAITQERAILSTNRALYATLHAEEAAPDSSERLHQLDLAAAFGQKAREEQAKAGRLEEAVVQQP